MNDHTHERIGATLVVYQNDVRQTTQIYLKVGYSSTMTKGPAGVLIQGVVFALSQESLTFIVNAMGDDSQWHVHIGSRRIPLVLDFDNFSVRYGMMDVTPLPGEDLYDALAEYIDDIHRSENVA